MFEILHYAYATFRMTLHCEAVTLGKRFFLLAVVRMTSFCNFFPAAKK